MKRSRGYRGCLGSTNRTRAGNQRSRTWTKRESPVFACLSSRRCSSHWARLRRPDSLYRFADAYGTCPVAARTRSAARIVAVVHTRPEQGAEQLLSRKRFCNTDGVNAPVATRNMHRESATGWAGEAMRSGKVRTYFAHTQAASVRWCTQEEPPGSKIATMVSLFSLDQAGDAASCSCTQPSTLTSSSSLSVPIPALYGVTPGGRLQVQQVHWHQWHAE